MKIYIIERDNPQYRPEPEVFLDGNRAVSVVKEEYSKNLRHLKKKQMPDMEDMDVIGILKKLTYAVMHLLIVTMMLIVGSGESQNMN